MVFPLSSGARPAVQHFSLHSVHCGVLKSCAVSLQPLLCAERNKVILIKWTDELITITISNEPAMCSTSQFIPRYLQYIRHFTREIEPVVQIYGGNTVSLLRLRHGAVWLHVPSLPVSPGSSVASDLQRLYSRS